jgi:hypothetical protein
MVSTSTACEAPRQPVVASDYGTGKRPCPTPYSDRINSIRLWLLRILFLCFVRRLFVIRPVIPNASKRLIAGTGLGRGRPYHLFPGRKEEMARAVLDDVTAWFEANVFVPLRESGDPESGIDHSRPDRGARA